MVTSLKFAAALVSIKMETPGPFKGTLEEGVELQELVAPVAIAKEGDQVIVHSPDVVHIGNRANTTFNF